MGAFICMYFIGFPISLILGFYFNLRMIGLLIGAIVGIILVTLYFYYKLNYSINWDEAIIEFKEREQRLREIVMSK